MDAPRDNLIRANLSERATVEGRTMTGYPIVFNEWTEIHSWEGDFRERIAPGALNKTLRERRGQIKVLFNHGMDPQIGDKPLGRPAVMRADDRGLYTEVPLAETSYNDDLLALMRDEAIDGQSFRFSVPEGKDEWNTPKKGLPERTINELRLYEFGPVTFPAYQATTVGLRSGREFMAWLNADDQKRSEIARLLGISIDLRTLESEADEFTSEDGAALPETLEPVGDHSSIHAYRAAVAKARLVGAIK